ncbi:unnamed protein product [Ranitomeya imitator]|uniref:Protein phosphatase 1 regulatory subunit 21 six-helix bundle domain-containing protein n=1 Tax=Ranitomeya imitator TaxID=111125 RepID=A0ABN9LQF4_9NEOB|nr:unnamed protein product [Ranitomeya imitator]
MAILEAYRVKNRVPPPGIKVQSTRAVGASWAVHHRASALQLCKAATWSSIHTFAKFYKIHYYASTDARLGRRILQVAVLKARALAGQCLAFVQDLVTALLNFHTYTEQRVQIFPIDSAIDVISPLNQKFSHYLHENASYVRPLEEGMLWLYESITEGTVTVLETAVKLQFFSEHFTSYVSYLQKILPYQLQRSSIAFIGSQSRSPMKSDLPTRPVFHGAVQEVTFQ